MWAHGPHKNEKLKRNLAMTLITANPTTESVTIYLPRLKTLPMVKRAANFLDFTRITGVSASACNDVTQKITYSMEKP